MMTITHTVNAPRASQLSVDDLAALAVRVRAGDHAAFEALYADLEHVIRAHIVRYWPDDEARTDDIAGIVWLRAWERREQFQVQFQGHGTIRAWLYRIATNECIDQHRRRLAGIRLHHRYQRDTPHSAVDARYEDDTDMTEWVVDERIDGDPERMAIRAETAAEVHAAIATALPRDRLYCNQRLAANDDVHHLAGMAEALHVSRSAIKSRSWRSQDRLRPRLLPIWREVAS